MNQVWQPQLQEELLEDIVEELDVPESQYEAAERAYKSVGHWLERPASSLRSMRPCVHVQGSFALGLATKPVTDGDEYDVDAVCELNGTKKVLTQRQLKEMLGRELELYAQAHNMKEKPQRKNRCWTLNYCEDAQFHLDALPALIDGQTAVNDYMSRGASNAYATTSIAITDERHPQFGVLTNSWLRSNPRGYADWFRSRQRVVFDARRKALASRAQAKVEDIPEYRVKTPLQAAIQILKRHRDIWACDDERRQAAKPISIILTTLAAHAYQQEATIVAALIRILNEMDRHIARRHGHAWIANPSDPVENFADKWVANPELEVGFFEWIAAARSDFGTVLRTTERSELILQLSARLGDRLVRVAAKKRVAPGGIVSRISSGLRAIFSAPHRQLPPWPQVVGGSVKIVSATMTRDGFRQKSFANDGTTLPKNASLKFIADTDVSGPYRVYWQVVNTGRDATRANGLRGNFEEQTLERGQLTRVEGTEFSGSHSIECFIVKGGYLVARSDPFVVNIS